MNDPLKNKPIWLYREPRTGSTWLFSFLARTLNRKHLFLEQYPNITLNWKPNEKHSKYIFSTHQLAFIKPVKMYDEALLLRSVRRNKFEQMLSLFFYDRSSLRYPFADGDVHKFELLIQKKISDVTEENVKIWLDEKRELESVWNDFTKDFPSQTLYYEDFEQGVQIEGTDIIVKFDELGTKKLPDYKEKVFINYDEIKYWYDKHS